jgi:DNA gyrase subunit B
VQSISASVRWISNRPKPVRPSASLIELIRLEATRYVYDLSRPSALGCLVDGALAFALDDAALARCNSIEVRVHRDGSASVTHDGPGFDPQRASRGLQRWPWLRQTPEGELVLTRSMSAPVVTNALSHWCHFEVHRPQGITRQAFYRGRPLCPLQVGARLSADAPIHTRVHFRPDPELFGELEFDIDDLYMRGLGSLLDLPWVRLTLHDERGAAPPLVIEGASLGG